MKDREVFCLNNISRVGTGKFRKGYTLVDTIDTAAAVLVRSADMKEMQFPKTQSDVPAPVSTISRWIAAQKKASSCSTRLAPMPMP